MRNEALVAWVSEIAGYTTPDAIHWCGGTLREARAVEDRMVEEGTLVRLNSESYPRCFLHRSNPSDVARTEHLTSICSDRAEDAGPSGSARVRPARCSASASTGRFLRVCIRACPEGVTL